MADPRSTLIFFVVSLTTVLNYHGVSSIQLDNDGGYHLNVAIDPNSEVSGSISYINNIRSSIQQFSSKLWEATEGRFFIKSTNLLVPSSWTISPQPAVSISQSFESSDIKLSTQSTVPFVQNPNPCGRSGDFIQLPVNFFETPNTGDFGTSWKVLLNQWARYRWGVWEEHGYPNSDSSTFQDNKFPYFYQTTGAQNSLQWTPNSCSNEELVGKYENVIGEACTMNGEETPNSTCRFIPDATNHASTSLMSFHWLNSVTKFCNGENHNKLAPNAQNWFCNYKSIMEVMEETPDYAAVTSPIENDVPIPMLNIVQANNVVPFYLLVDRGFADSGAAAIVTEVIRNLVPLYESILPKNILTAFGTYPGETNELKEEIPWKFLASHEDEFLAAIGRVELNGPTVKNFATALEQVGNKINSLNLPNGAVILLVKTEASSTTFDSIKYEDQLLANLIEKKIKIFTIEVPNTGENPQFVLQGLTTRLGGMYVGLDNSRAVQEKVEPLLQGILAEITSPTKQEILISYSGTVNLSSTDPIVINIGGRKSKVNFGLTLRNDVTIDTETEINLDGSSDYSTLTRNEWNMTSRHVKTIVHNYKEKDDGRLSLGISCSSGCNEFGYLIITEELVEPLQNVIKVSVSTSADGNNNVNFSDTNLPELSPFSVYAKVEADGKPVSNAIVSATLISDTAEKHTIQLFDDGLGVPDVSRNDGIYSNVFIPPADGSYSILVKVEATGEVATVGSFSSRLLPVDQVEIGCRENCESVGIKEPISIVRNLPNIVKFTNVVNYPNTGKPTKILDLKTINDEAKRLVRFEFTSPKVLGSSTGKATKYVIKGSATQEAFFAPDTPNLFDVLIHDTYIKPPGMLETFEAPLHEELYYFAIFSYNGDKESSMSPVIRMQGKPIVSEDSSSTTPNTESTTPGATDATSPGTGTGDPTGSTPTSGTDEPPAKEDKPFFKTAGGIVLIVFLVLGAIAAAGGGFWYYKKKQGANNSNNFA